MSDFGDHFLGAVVVFIIIVYSVFMNKPSVHVYDAAQERIQREVDCILDNLPEGFSDEQYNQAERNCRTGENR